VLKVFARTIVSVLCAFAFCLGSGASFAQDQPPQGRPAPGQITQPIPTSSETRMGMWRGRPVTYQVINGRNIYEGDIILENVQPMPSAGSGGGVHPDSVGLVNSNYLWPKVNGVAQIPYVIDPGSADRDNLNSAISTYNSTFAGVIQLVPRTTQANYIDINLSDSPNGVCEATEGDAGAGEQFVDGASDCTIATILHEFGHVTGVWHEQSRTDAANYVTFNYANVIKGSIGNFLPAVDNDQQNFTPYDFASVMEYPAFSFDRNGAPPLDSIPPGMPLSNLVGYSAADVEGIMRLYGVAPTQVTVTSNPPGLQVMVDGSPVTTPMTYSWTLNSTHTLAVAAGVQTVNSIIAGSSDPVEPTTFYYTYGVWNDGGAQNHTITVTPGNGDAGFPSTAPQVATYSANFIQLVPYTPTIYPASSGTVALTGTPSPQNLTVNGVPGTYVVARQQATLTASAASGYSFYEFNNGPYWLAGGLSSNPKTFYVPETGLTLNTGVEFTNTPVYTVDVTPDYFSSNLSVTVDGGFWYVPKNFSSFYDSTWTANSSHTLQFFSPAQPFDFNTQFVFSSWNVGGTANPDSITLPATSTSYIATIDPEYVPATNFPPCGGTATITPASIISGGFYPTNTELTYTETPSPNTGGSPWIFTGWTWDLSGTTNPDTLSPTDESLVYANFNTTSSPLTITSLSPSSVASGGPDLTLTINGTGFTQNGTGNPIENVGFNFFEGPFFNSITFVNSTQLKVTVPAANTATPGTFLLFVENYPSSPWGGCAVFAYQPFFVSQSAGSGATTVTATPTSVTFPSTVLNATSTGSTITVKNTGSSTATTVSISASSNFGQTNTCPVAPSTLAAGATCTITPTFTPNTVGSLSGNISIFDSATNSPQVVTLSGTATPATTTVTATPTTYNFGGQAVGTTSNFQIFTVQNTGAAYTSIAISITGNFAQLNNCGNQLDAGASCTINVTFTPTVAGPLSGSISVTDQATNSPQMISLSGSGTGTVVVTPTPSSLTFPSQTVGTTSSSQSVTVKNTGAVATPLSIGAATGDFAQTNNCLSTLAAGGSCTLTVTFTPTTTGTRTGSISITDQATNSPQSVSLTGTGAAAVITVTATPTSLTFSATAVGSTSASQAITVKNTGTGNTTVSIAASTNFAQTNNCPVSPATLNAGVSCTVNASFVPTATGSLSGTISVTDSASNSPQTVTLSGTGLTTMTVTPSSLSFGNQNVGTTSTSQAITVKNTGTASTAITVAASSSYGQTNNCGTSLAGGATCTVNVTFSPTSSGSLPGSITITDSASTSPQSVTLSGTGTTVIVTPSPASLTFPSQTVGTTSSSMSFTVTNTGTGSTTLTIGAATGDFAQTNNCTGSLAATNGTCTVNVTFSPTATGTRTGSISITDQATNSPQSVSLTGTGTAASVTVTPSPTSLTFGSQNVGTTSGTMSFTVTNSGTGSTTLSIGAATGDFAQTNNCPASLAANGGFCTVNVTFAPTAAGTRTGAVSITDQATNSPQTVSLTGTGASSGTVIVTATPTSETFAAQNVGTTSAAKTVTVKNTGTASTSLSFAATGDFAAVGGETTPCGTTLGAKSASCTISVTFSPTTSGTLTGTLSVTDSATNSPQTVSLTGTGKALTVIVTPSPTSETFAAQAIGTTSAAKTITVKNTGTGSTPITISPATGDFAVASTTCGPTLGASPASCTISVTFTPESAGTLTGSISITDNATTSPQTVSLTGTGKAGTVVVTASPTTETFSATTIGVTSAPKTVTVKNTGTASTPLTISPATGDFAESATTCGTTLGPSPASCTISVTFTPEAVGTLTGDITITDNATNSPQTVKLTGTGTEPVVITISPASEAFTATAVGSTSAQKTITVKNTGAESTMISIVSSGDFASATNTCTGTLSSGGTCTINETFSPTVTGAVSGAITITDTATNSPQIVGLSGTGLAPVTFSPVSLAFGSVAVGNSSAAQTITMTNNLSSTLSFGSSASGNYSVVTGGTCSGSLAAGAKCTIDVQFSPTAKTTIDGVLSISSVSFATQEVKLTGTGTGGTTSPLTLTPASLTFASQIVNSTSTAKIVTVKNVSASPVTFTSIVASGNFVAAAGTTPCTGSLASNASCEISVTFSPTVIGSNPGAVTVTDNGTVDQQIVNLSGTAIAPVTFTPASLTFTSQATGTTSAPQTVTLKNNSATSSLTLNGIVTSGDFAIATGGTCGASVAANSTCTFNVTFTPDKTGSIGGVVTVTDSAGNSPQVVKLTGTGSS